MKKIIGIVLISIISMSLSLAEAVSLNVPMEPVNKNNKMEFINYLGTDYWILPMLYTGQVENNEIKKVTGFGGISYLEKYYFSPVYRDQPNFYYYWNIWGLVPFVGLGVDFYDDNYFWGISTKYIFPEIHFGIKFDIFNDSRAGKAKIGEVLSKYVTIDEKQIERRIVNRYDKYLSANIVDKIEFYNGAYAGEKNTDISGTAFFSGAILGGLSAIPISAISLCSGPLGIIVFPVLSLMAFDANKKFWYNVEITIPEHKKMELNIKNSDYKAGFTTAYIQKSKENNSISGSNGHSVGFIGTSIGFIAFLLSNILSNINISLK